MGKTTSDSLLVTGVTVVRKEILEKYPSQVADFLNEYSQSIAWVNSNNQEAASLIVDLNIVGKEAIALKALPYCNLVCITATEMQNILSGYLNTLLLANPNTIGGKLPDEDFYFTQE